MTQLGSVIPAIAQWFNGGRFYGCAFMNAAVEHAKGESEFREMAGEHHRQTLVFLEGPVAAAAPPEPKLLAWKILLKIDGTIADLMVAGNEAVLKVAPHGLNTIRSAASWQAAVSPR